MSAEEFPPALRRLMEGITERGFRLVREVGSGYVNRLLDYSDGRLGVRITVDRGHWWLECGPVAEPDWFDPDVWCAFENGRPARLEMPSLDEQVDYLLDALPRMARLSGAPVINALRNLRDRRAYTLIFGRPDLDAQ